MTIQGRILPQTEPYCRASFLVEITLSHEYPFKEPEVLFLDPISHPHIHDWGGYCRHYSNTGSYEPYKQTTSLSDFIMGVINIIDSEPGFRYCSDPGRIAEYQRDYQTFYKKALELTLSYGRPRY